MKNWCVLPFAATLAACASAPMMQHPGSLLQDGLFAPASVRINAADVFALSPAMRQYVSSDMRALLLAEGLRRGLVSALYDKHQLMLHYDSELTRNAAETFAAKAGNCLSLVIMTAAFAKYIGVPVRYQRVLLDDAWSRSGDFYFSSGHVDLTLDSKSFGTRVLDSDSASLTIDFLGAEDISGRRVTPISEETVVAMYMNNRAAEALARGQLDDAYWWAREAVLQDPSFLNSFDTLGVIYLRHGNLAQAQAVLKQVLALEPDNPQVMSNLIRVLNDEGSLGEAKTLSARLHELQPYPPFYFFNLGRDAMRRGDFKAAKDLFTREIDRDAYYHEFHFWRAVADVGLGDFDDARTQLTLAMDASPTRREHELYAAKLDRLRATHPE
jgi:tetratricopeptide (TPR) repeat protein